MLSFNFAQHFTSIDLKLSKKIPEGLLQKHHPSNPMEMSTICELVDLILCIWFKFDGTIMNKLKEHL